MILSPKLVSDPVLGFPVRPHLPPAAPLAAPVPSLGGPPSLPTSARSSFRPGTLQPALLSTSPRPLNQHTVSRHQSQPPLGTAGVQFFSPQIQPRGPPVSARSHHGAPPPPVQMMAGSRSHQSTPQHGAIAAFPNMIQAVSVHGSVSQPAFVPAVRYDHFMQRGFSSVAGPPHQLMQSEQFIGGGRPGGRVSSDVPTELGLLEHETDEATVFESRRSSARKPCYRRRGSAEDGHGPHEGGRDGQRQRLYDRDGPHSPSVSEEDYGEYHNGDRQDERDGGGSAADGRVEEEDLHDEDGQRSARRRARKEKHKSPERKSPHRSPQRGQRGGRTPNYQVNVVGTLQVEDTTRDEAEDSVSEDTVFVGGKAKVSRKEGGRRSGSCAV